MADASAVRVGVSGIIATAALGTSAPTSAVSSIAAFTDVGFVGEDGLTETNDQTIEKIHAWQNNVTVRTTVTEGEASFQFVLLETNVNTIALAYGSTVGVDGSIIVSPGVERPHKAFVLDIIDGTNINRNWIPDGQITELGDIVYANGEAIGYEVTLTAYAHASLDGGKGSVQKWWSQFAGALTAPAITSVLPSGAGAGAMVKIVGTRFTSTVPTTGVKFGGTNAAAFSVDDDGTIYATLPAGSAGSAPVIVTNSAGASSGFAYTRAT